VSTIPASPILSKGQCISLALELSDFLVAPESQRHELVVAMCAFTRLVDPQRSIRMVDELGVQPAVRTASPIRREPL
jgi:hypothetical protein